MKVLLIVVIAISTLFATSNGESDSLRLELEAITKRLEAMERDNLEKKRAQLEDELRKRNAMKPAKDTIIVIDTIIVDKGQEYEKSRTEEIILKLNKKIARSGGNGFGGSGGPSIGLGIFSVKPVRNVIKSDLANYGEKSSFNGLGFESEIDGNYENFLVTGGFGFGGLGNGIRIGGAGYGATRKYKSVPTSASDTIVELELHIGYGGVLLEKSWSSERSTIAVGTLLGAGEYSMSINNSESVQLNGNDSLGYQIYHNTSSFFVGELHCAFTVSLTPWFHLGLEGYSMLMASGSGFKTSEGYATFNGGGRLRILFGNLG